ncbi:recombinase RecX [Pontibacillus halophilus JSM 076056 = DSM 19796]|uniref:Regulatory protein RecX n=1 Tax=Pontibacillus halophilus JSM 076056 = DSM 19796 TaxID=1385510 RepID=A0A0A5GLA5_9BACI|nr:recombination regulator RecX [Pontibacillus halophilus]KGX94031.1 recombinase RecX [Pontibacillus halophilus JSM 076056 = DSM 19796]
MAKLTRITTQKKNKQRYNIFLDRGDGEAFAFSVSEEILVQSVLRKGMELDEELIQTLIEQDDFHKTFTLALNYLSYRMRSQKEIRTYLIGKEVDEEKIEYVVGRLLDEGYLNDSEFAEALVRTRVNTSSKGPVLVKQELIEKGVSKHTIEDALMHYPREQEFEKALKLAHKKFRLDGRTSHREQMQKVQAALLQKGFSSDVIQDVMQELKEDQDGDDDAEWQAVVHQGEKALRKYAAKAEGFELKHKIKGALYRKGFPFEQIERFLDEYVNE